MKRFLLIPYEWSNRFFDILGYRSILDNNSSSDTAASDIALKILDLIMSVSPQVKCGVSKLDFSELKLATELKESAGAVKHLVFSDTVLFALRLTSAKASDD
jgi:hypothetical protein